MQLLPLSFQEAFMPSQVDAVKRFKNGDVSPGEACAMRVYHLALALVDLIKVTLRGTLSFAHHVLASPFYAVVLPGPLLLVSALKAIGDMIADSKEFLYHMRWVVNPENGAFFDLEREQNRINRLVSAFTSSIVAVAVGVGLSRMTPRSPRYYVR